MALGPNHRGARRAIALLFSTALLAACGSNASTEPSGSASSSASDEADDPASTEPTVEPTPAISPATGETIKVKGMRVNAPKGWLTSISVAAGQSAYPRGVTGTLVGLHLFPNSQLLTVEELAVEELGYIGAGKKRLDDLLIDGYQVYHLQASPEPGVQLERFGTIVNDGRVAILFRFGNRESRAQRDEIIQSVLATVQLG